MPLQAEAPGQPAGGDCATLCWEVAETSVQDGSAGCDPGAAPAADAEVAARLLDLTRARREAWERAEAAAASAELDRSLGAPIPERATTRVKGILRYHGYDLAEIEAFANGVGDPATEADMLARLGLGKAPPAPLPSAARDLLGRLLGERDALRARARAALAKAGLEPDIARRVLDGSAGSADTIDAANDLTRAGWPAGDVLAALPGLASLAVRA
ncbi:MAG: hypothetical protein LBD90_01610 [Bifidobacteriaceae bacterium]|jgi:hypothetical protein|nr:hypothetical protein [Bifidobacteriaceae bacterium]